MKRYKPKYTDATKIYELTDKIRNVRDQVAYMLDRTQSMFHYTNLPDTIPADVLELFTQTAGHVCWTRAKLIGDEEEKLYIFVGGPGGEPDVYYRPTKYVIANPNLSQTLEKTIDEDCVIMRNDECFQGLLPIFEKYATMMAENELTMSMADINLRIQTIVSADDDNTRESADQFFNDIKKGKYHAVANSTFLDGVRTDDFGKTGGRGILTDLIEFQQYLKASQFNEIGLDANYNMKRESLNSTEAQMNDDALMPLIDNMLLCRQRAIEKVNNMFGTDITVELTSVWRATQEEIEQVIDEDTQTDDTTPEDVTDEAEEEQEQTAGEENTDNETDTDTETDTEQETDTNTEDDENEQNEENSEEDTDAEEDGEEDQDADGEGNSEGTQKIEIEISVKDEEENKDEDDS